MTLAHLLLELFGPPGVAVARLFQKPVIAGNCFAKLGHILDF
jgi:hypothetical protein